MPSSARSPRDLPSFPTRRSSDLAPDGQPPGPRGPRAHRHRGGGVRGRRGARRPLARGRRGAPVARHRPDRDRAPREVQLDHLDPPRSEEHTSELQSLRHLVCRLLPAPPATSPLSLHDALPIWLRMVNLQVLAALALIVIGAVEFVGAVEHVAHSLGVDEVLLSLVIAPIATELPEKFNSIIWIRQGKDTLAMGNITGAMVFQSCIPTIVALVLAPAAWVAGPGTYVAFASAGIAFLSSAVIFIPMARSGRLRGTWLLVGGAFYAVYLVVVVLAVLRPAA